MCYSALVYAKYRRFIREFGAIMSLQDFAKAVFRDPAKEKRPKWPKAMEEAFADPQTEEEQQISEAIQRWRVVEIAQLEQEIFKQRKRIADGEHALQVKTTRKAQEDVRIGTNKVALAKERLEALKRSEEVPDDSRIYPGYHCPVMIVENGQRVIKPMRYQCRLPGWTDVIERKFPGTYNARRDSLRKSWDKVFGYTHGVILAQAFYEHVDQQGKDVVLEFRPKTGEEMIVACLWTRTVERDGSELLSFAAVTDDPPAEVIAAGHDRCIIPIKRVHLDAWLNPDPSRLDELDAILEDRERPHYEHREAA
jgi:putative SOS response-associated peptidase YedK